jgi:hypothetical protein
MMRVLIFSVLTLLLFSQQTPRGKKDDYDPDKLNPGEVACGREGSKKSAPCTCAKERHKKIAEMYEQCDLNFAGDKAKYRECVSKIPECWDMKVVDEDEARRTDMPAQCKRSCTRARCECCKS